MYHFPFKIVVTSQVEHIDPEQKILDEDMLTDAPSTPIIPKKPRKFVPTPDWVSVQFLFLLFILFILFFIFYYFFFGSSATKRLYNGNENFR